MSFDGALEIKVANSELLKIMKDHLKKGTFEGSEAIPSWIGTKYKRRTLALDYAYYECAYIDYCPKKLDQVLDGIIQLFDEYAYQLDASAYENFKQELHNKRDKINASFSFVAWVYTHDDYDDETEESYLFQDGEESYEES